MPSGLPWFVVTGGAGACAALLLFTVLLRLAPPHLILAALIALCFGAGVTWLVNRLFLHARRVRVDAAERLLLRALYRHGGPLPAQTLPDHLPLPPELTERALRLALHKGTVLRDGDRLRLPEAGSR